MIDISFEDVSYRVQATDEDGEKYAKTILNGVSGVFRGGELSVIMGASGAGKTTLLNILAGRVAASEGAICANGLPYDFHSFGGFGNYVMQGDILMETLTVRETLEFAASLKIRD
jgi:ABC-type multidrug transport system ATPase subunit